MSEHQQPTTPQPSEHGRSVPAGGYGSGYGAAEPKTLSIVSLVLGLASIFLGISILVPVAGIIVGVMARKREPAGRTMALWGIWLTREGGRIASVCGSSRAASSSPRWAWPPRAPDLLPDGLAHPGSLPIAASPTRTRAARAADTIEPQGIPTTEAR